MGLETWKAGDLAALHELAALLPEYHSLRYPDFVDHYYGASESCRLFLLRDDSGRILSCAGVEKLPLSTPDGPKTLAIGTNYHAFQPGAGAFLFLHWFRSGDLGALYGGSPDARNLVLNQKAFALAELAGLKTLQTNHAYADSPSESTWRRVAKSLLRHSPFRTRVDERSRRMLERGPVRIEAVPESRFSSDMLLPASGFAVRLNPSCEWLNWRYATDLSFVKYRLFRIVADQQPAGFVVLNEQPHRVLVAQADGPDAWTLSQGICAALAQSCRQSRRRTGVLLTSSQPAVLTAFREFGFQEHRGGRVLALGARRLPAWASNGSQWLIHEDWGDNGLRPPFLGSHRITAMTPAASSTGIQSKAMPGEGTSSSRAA